MTIQEFILGRRNPQVDSGLEMASLTVSTLEGGNEAETGSIPTSEIPKGSPGTHLSGTPNEAESGPSPSPVSPNKEPPDIPLAASPQGGLVPPSPGSFATTGTVFEKNPKYIFTGLGFLAQTDRFVICKVKISPHRGKNQLFIQKLPRT